MQRQRAAGAVDLDRCAQRNTLERSLDEAMGKVNKLRHVVALTSQITVTYVKPVPLHKPLRVESREVRVKGRRHVNMAEILDQKGEVLAHSRGVFIAIDPQRMFSKQHTRKLAEPTEN